MPLYPTERVLWDESLIPSTNYTGEGALALPKLNLQFLTPHDYLIRNFNLFRLEASYEIREDVGDVLSRVGAFYDDGDDADPEAEPKVRVSRVVEGSERCKGGDSARTPLQSGGTDQRRCPLRTACMEQMRVWGVGSDAHEGSSEVRIAPSGSPDARGDWASVFHSQEVGGAPPLRPDIASKHCARRAS